jgi:hypothetical protein
MWMKAVTRKENIAQEILTQNWMIERHTEKNKQFRIQMPRNGTEEMPHLTVILHGFTICFMNKLYKMF